MPPKKPTGVAFEPVKKMPPSSSVRGPMLSMDIPRHRKLFIFGRYKLRELSFHEQIWRDMGLEVTRDPSCRDWTVRWSMRVQPDEWRSFQSWQKTNYLPGVNLLIRKDHLHKCIVAMQRRHGEEKLDFWPVSFNLPEEWGAWKRYTTEHPSLPWILKPPQASCGRRIQVFHSAADIRMGPTSEWILQNRPLAQVYTDTPLLDGHKFTFRIYCVLTGVDPLRVYVYNDGLCRIASRAYSKEKESFGDAYVHLDSVDVNVGNKDDPPLHLEGIEYQGLRSTVRRVLKYFEEKGAIKSAQALWDEICAVVVKSVLCAEHEMLAASRKFVRHRNTCFDLLGYDILLDDKFKPWIIEINHSPSMAPLTPMENAIKHGMLSGYFALADLALVHRETQRAHVVRFFENVTKRRVAGEAEYQLDDFALMHQQQLLQVTRLSQRDVFVLVATWMEAQRKGGFERVFPCEGMSEKYGDLYHKNRNVLLQLWIDQKLDISEFLN